MFGALPAEVYGAGLVLCRVGALVMLIPGVGEAIVVGVPHPEWGEDVVAFVVPRPGATVTPAELDRLCLDNIARFKRPKDYKFVEVLPKNNYGKILKTELRTLL